MKYFELALDSAIYKTAPRLVNWYGVQDVRLIRWETYHKLKKRQIYNIEPSPETVFTDIVSVPFLLVSPMVRDTIMMYGDRVVFKEIILVDAKNQREQIYYLPVMEENPDIGMFCAAEDIKRDYKDLPQWMNERNIFWIRQKGERHTIISLDLAESLLRRNAVGLALKEVRLAAKTGAGEREAGQLLWSGSVKSRLT